MVSNNIIIILIVLLVVGIVVYFYFNRKNNPIIDNFTAKINPDDSGCKKVRFSRKIKYNTYSAPESDLIISSAGRCRPDEIIDVDTILSETSRSDSDSGEELSLRCKIVPSNVDTKDPEETWYSSFGLPLMSDGDKKAFVNKIKKNHKAYQKSLGEYSKYQTDDSTIIKTDVTIDPFKNEKLVGKAVKDIYDKQVAGPKAKPKKIKNKSDACTIYEDESELNGGSFEGTCLHGFDEGSDDYKSAAFGNAF